MSTVERRTEGRDDAAVNEVLGSILLMLVAMGLVGAFILVLFSVPGPSPTSHAAVQAFIAPTDADELVLEHRGGPSIAIRDLVATVNVNGTPTRYAVADHLGGAWTVRSTSGATKSATESFVVGDQAIFSSPTLYKASTSVTIIDAQQAALALGATAVAEADQTAPAIRAAITTSTTTVVVNFSEPLRALTTSDISVDNAIPSSVVLLGNGSRAELTVTAFATSATPVVRAGQSVTGAMDAAGNLLANGSVTASDGVAPAITAGPSASPTSSTATLTWTTGESGNSVVRYGPTPEELTIPSVTENDGTSHSVQLTGLTDNFRYYYSVSTTDAAANTVTSTTGNFVTSTVSSGGGGGGNGDPVPYQFVLNRTLSPVTSGVPSAGGTSTFHVGLRNATAQTITATSDVSVTLTTNSTVGYFLDASGNLLDPQTFKIAAGSSYAEFRYVDFRDGGYSVLGATSANVTPAFTTVQVSGSTGKGIPYRLEWVTQDNDQASGTATGNLQVALRDAYDNLVLAPFTIRVNLTTNSSVGTFLASGTPVVSTNITAGSSTSAALTYVDHRPAGTASLLTAASQGMLPATMPVLMSGSTTSVLAPGNRLEFTHVNNSLTSGTASTTDYRVELKDATGRSILPDQNVLVRLSTNSSLGYFLDPDGSTVVTTRTLTTTNGTAWFKYVDHRANGTSLLSASVNGTLSAVATTNVTGRSVAGPGDRIVWSTAPTSVASGTVLGPFQLQLRNQWNEQTTAPTARQVTLDTNSSSGFFCADASCATLITSVNISSGAALSGEFYYRDYRFSAMSVLMASSPQVVPALHVVAVTGGTPPWDHLAWTTAPTTLASGGIAGPYTITLRDHNGLARVTPTAVQLELATNSTSGNFCADAACATRITRINVTAGGSTTAAFYYTDSRYSAMSVLLASSARVTPAMHVIAVTGGTPPSTGGESTHRLAWTTAPTTMTAGSIAGPFVITLQDPTGATATSTGGETLTLLTNSTYATFCADASCATLTSTVSIANGASTTGSFYYRDPRHSSMSALSAFSPGRIPGAHAIGVTGGSNWTASVTPVPHHIRFTTVNSTLEPGINSTAYSITLYDANGTQVQPLSALTVELGSSREEGVFLDNTTLAPITSVSIGTSNTTAFFKYRDNTSGGRGMLFANANNVIGAQAPIRVYERGLVPRWGDSDASLVVFGNYPSDVDIAEAVSSIGIVVANPTPTARTITSISMVVTTPGIDSALFTSSWADGPGADANFTACTLPSGATNNWTCNATVQIPAWGIAQYVGTFTTGGTFSDESFAVRFTAYTNNTTAYDDVQIHTEATTAEAQMIEVFGLLDTTATNKVAGHHHLRAGVDNALNFRIEHRTDVIGYLATFSIPSGWGVDVPVSAATNFSEGQVGVQRPRLEQRGYVTVSYNEGNSAGTGDLTFYMNLKPPAGFIGIEVIYVMLTSIESNQAPLATQLTPIVVEVDQ